MPRNPTAVREVLLAILKTARQAPSQEDVDDIRARLMREPNYELTDETLAALAETESWRIEEAQSLLPHARRLFPGANFDDIEKILGKLDSMRETDPLSVDTLLTETMKRYWERVEPLKLSKRISALATAVGDDIAACQREVRKALADSAARLKLDDQEPDPADVDAVKDLADAAVGAAERWRTQLGAFRKALDEDPSQVDDGMVSIALENANQDRSAPQAELDERLKTLNAATAELKQVQELRLSSIDEVKLSNSASRVTRALSEKLVKALCAELDIKPPEKWRNAFDYLQALKDAGTNKTAQAKASKQKPSVALAAYLQLAEPAGWGSHGTFLRERANDFDGQRDKAAQVLRALAAIGDTDRAVNQWLVRLALNGTPLTTLARYHAARADLAGVAVPSTYTGKLDELMATPTFDATVWARLKLAAATKFLFLSSVVAFLKTEDETIATRVGQDYYGLVATTRPGNTEEGRIATGLTAEVIEQSKQRTVHTTATGSGHAYKYHYAGGFVRSIWELHVHEGKSNLHPAWKHISNPDERVLGRDSYVINGALRSLLT